MKNLLYICIAIAFFSFTPEVYAVFSFYRTITVNSGQVSSGPHTNFPMLVSGTYSYLATEANGGKVKNANGYDIGFYSNSDCSTGKLDWEIETYAATTGAVNYWVEVASINDGSVIYLCYGDSSISESQANPTGVWDSGYKGVWHLPNGSTLTAGDSTSNANTLTISGATVTTGKIDGGASCDGTNDQLSLTTFTHGIGTGDFTWSAWVYPTRVTGNYDGVMSIDTYNPNMAIKVGGNTNWGSYWGAERPSGNNLTASNWYYLVMKRSGSTVSFTQNGADTATNHTITTSIANGAFRLCNNGSTAWLQGTIDEARVSSSLRTDGWDLTEYRNQNAPSSFYTIGDEPSSAVTPARIMRLFDGYTIKLYSGRMILHQKQ